MNDAFVDKLPRLVPILEKDSVRLFLNLFKHETRGLAWGFVITPDTFNEMIVQNALRCAKVALEGKAPELKGHRANPNYVNSSGYFPLHHAAEMFSADMIDPMCETLTGRLRRRFHGCIRRSYIVPIYAHTHARAHTHICMDFYKRMYF